MTHIAVAVGGAFGALARYWVGLAVGTPGFPWATLGINTAGSFLLGTLLGFTPGRWNATLITSLGVGFLGAFTTFSTFAHETVAMLRANRAGSALAYVTASVVLGVVAAALGYALSRSAA